MIVDESNCHIASFVLDGERMDLTVGDTGWTTEYTVRLCELKSNSWAIIGGTEELTAPLSGDDVLVLHKVGFDSGTLSLDYSFFLRLAH